MKKAKLIKLGLAISFLAIPTTVFAGKHGPRKSITRKVTAPVRKAKEALEKAFQQNILVIDSREHKAVIARGDDLDELKQTRANEFCQSQGYIFAKEANFSEVSTPYTGLRYSPRNKVVTKATVKPVTSLQYTHTNYQGVKTVISKEEYRRQEALALPGQKNRYIGQSEAPVPSILVKVTCSKEPDPNEEELIDEDDLDLIGSAESSDSEESPTLVGDHSPSASAISPAQPEVKPARTSRRSRRDSFVQAPLRARVEATAPRRSRSDRRNQAEPRRQSSSKVSLSNRPIRRRATSSTQDRDMAALLQVLFDFIKDHKDNQQQLLALLQSINDRLEPKPVTAAPAQAAAPATSSSSAGTAN
jgi:hypothetical protein